MRYLLEQNIALLHQTRDLLATLASEKYDEPVPACFNSTVGGHLRHLLDHYQSFFKGTEARRIDYEHRERDSRLEREVAHALLATEGVIQRLAEMTELSGDRTVVVQVEDLQEHEADAEAASSLRRELVFLMSHTVHHCALIGVCCHQLGVAIPSGFGVAPSTLRHRALSCASGA
jgi:uncharacterized damage-inducible protein DinB